MLTNLKRDSGLSQDDWQALKNELESDLARRRLMMPPLHHFHQSSHTVSQ